MFRRPSQNLVVASDSFPALFRPANQLRLTPAQAANPQLNPGTSMLPGMGNYQRGNGMSSMGLQSGAADQRMIRAIAANRAELLERQHMAQLSGSPSSRSRPVMTVSLAQALSALPSAPNVDALQVRFAWAGDSIEPDRQQIIVMYDLRPVKAFGKIQTWVTPYFGADIDKLKDELGRQPIVSIFDVQPYMPIPAQREVELVPQWEHIETKNRPDGVSRWVVTCLHTPSGDRYAATLYRTVAGADNEVIRTDNLSTLDDARRYIKAYEVREGNFAAVDHPKKVAYWAKIDKKGSSPANAYSAAARASMAQMVVVNDPTTVMNAATASAPVEGLGAVDTKAMFLAIGLIAGAFYLSKNKAR